MAYVMGVSTPRSATVTATTDVIVMKVTPQSLLSLLDLCQLLIYQAFLGIMAERLRFADNRFASMLCS